jgi:quercetin dioxygenase-like cupin family protein
MSDTCEPTIVSRVDNLGEAAITSWGEQASIRALRVANDNNFCILDYRAPAGFGPPRHLHYVQDEVLEILDGSIAVWTPDWCGVLHAGDIVSLPAGVPHAWRSIDDQAVHFTITVTPGGPGGFKEFFPTIQQWNPHHRRYP